MNMEQLKRVVVDRENDIRAAIKWMEFAGGLGIRFASPVN